MTHRRPPQAPLLAAVLASFWIAACAVGDSPTDAVGAAAVVPQPSLIPSASDASADPINRIRAVAARQTDGAVLAEVVLDVDPNASEWAVDISLPTASGVSVLVYLYLINVATDGTEAVQFSGVSAPIVVDGSTQATPAVPIVRGPLGNSFVTSVAITTAPSSLMEGQTATLASTVAASPGTTPTVFWTALDTAVLTLTDSTATAVTPGVGRVVASAGAFADTVAITVLSSDMTPPMVLGFFPQDGATGIPLDVIPEASFDEAISIPSLAAGFTLTDSVGATVASTVDFQDGVATLVPTLPLDTLHSYTATLSTAVTDTAGNALAAPVSWSFTTQAGASLLSSFNPGLGQLIAVGFDERSGNLFIQDDFNPATYEFTTAGVQVAPTIPTPGPSSNDLDLDFADVATGFPTSGIPANTLFVLNGEVSPSVLYAVDKDDGSVRDSLTLPVTGQMVGGSYHAARNTFFSVEWQADVISEIDIGAGQAVASFSPVPTGSPFFGIFFGDMEVDPATGNLLIVSSDQNTIRVLTPDGAFVKDVPVGHLGITSMSGIAWDNATATAWIVTTTGNVYNVAGIR